MEDFNSPDICWTTQSGQSTSSRANCNLDFHHDLSQMVEFPTHISGNTLDLIFSPPTLTVTDLQSVSCPLLKSDHHILSFSSSISHSHIKCSSSKAALDYKRAHFYNISFSLMTMTSDHTTNQLILSFSGITLRAIFFHPYLFIHPHLIKDLITLLSGSTLQ